MSLRYRWRTPTRKGRWRATIHEAWVAAAKAGEAAFDEHDPERVYLYPLTQIESDERHDS